MLSKIFTVKICTFHSGYELQRNFILCHSYLCLFYVSRIVGRYISAPPRTAAAALCQNNWYVSLINDITSNVTSSTIDHLSTNSYTTLFFNHSIESFATPFTGSFSCTPFHRI
ncbi:hypothetical protein TSAR_013924 [Trichomalopsis sarcophagae]|uniref:Uncharacterized protein n=1 Tax=Trichomalopsis sarcophagae TaxID=543379 RepID=A0A232ERM2_9HYME|nr:hypothetical protein TSAR_013924 [Trichomalopsis sarcophagae]